MTPTIEILKTLRATRSAWLHRETLKVHNVNEYSHSNIENIRILLDNPSLTYMDYGDNSGYELADKAGWLHVYISDNFNCMYLTYTVHNNGPATKRVKGWVKSVCELLDIPEASYILEGAVNGETIYKS